MEPSRASITEDCSGTPASTSHGWSLKACDAVPSGKPEPAGDRKEDGGDQDPGDPDCASELHNTDQFPYDRTSHAVQTTW